MKAVLCRDWGAPETLTYEEVADPVLRAGEVLVGVRAVSANFADTLVVQGHYQMRPPLPFSPDFEVAGEVLEAQPS